jgi:hypothetical protein
LIEPDADEIEMLADVCRHLTNFIDKGTWAPESALEIFTLQTLVRSRGTFESIVDLVVESRPLQAAMLSRSLFEDMAVMHWVLLHAEDPHWLLERFARHAQAMRLQAWETQSAYGFDVTIEDELLEQQDDLRKEFGRFAERDWWGQDRSGERLTMPSLVDKLARAERFNPRFTGEAPILRQYYAINQKQWTQALHHTAAGMGSAVAERGAFPVSAGPPPFLILAGNHWVFAQSIWGAIELAAPAVLGYFEKLFFAGLAVFNTVAGVEAPWHEHVEKWASELDDS